MMITINGKPKDFPAETTLAEVVENEKIPEKGTAIAVNGKVARRKDFATKVLQEGDSLIVISAAYGG